MTRNAVEIGRHRAEQRQLVAHRPQVRHALAAVGQRHRQIPDHPPQTMARPLGASRQ
jgi:hypothetical protein